MKNSCGSVSLQDQMNSCIVPLAPLLLGGGNVHFVHTPVFQELTCFDNYTHANNTIASDTL